MDPVLASVLKPLSRFLDASFIRERGLVELNCNAPCEIWLEYADSGYEKLCIPELTISYWDRLCNVLAATSGQIYSADYAPLVSTRLPQGHRFEAVVNRASETGISVSIRMKRDINLSFADFGLNEFDIVKIKKAVKDGSNIVISGGTSSGKTSFSNLLIESIPLEKRLFIIEDTRELNAPHSNKLSFVVARNEKEEAKILGYDQVIDHAMRSRPDQVLLGEISIKNAHPCLLLLNTGHRGLLTTIHADSPEMVLEEGFAQRIELAGKVVDRSSLRDYLYSAIDLIIQIRKTPSGKRQADPVFIEREKTKPRLYKQNERKLRAA